MKIFGLFAAGLLCLQPLHAASFRDDFNTLSSDWLPSANRKLGGTTWQPGLASVRDGMLVLKHTVKGAAMNGAEVAWRYPVLYGTLSARIKGCQAAGVLSTLFLYGYHDGKTHEIDAVEAFPDERGQLHLTVYKDWVEEDGYVLGPHRDYFLARIPGYDSRDWHTYSIRWEPKKVTWFIDGRQVFESAKIVPYKPVSIMLNTWHPPTWAKSTPKGDSEQWVDWVEWKEMPENR